MLPKQVFPPLFNRYDAGMTFGAHVDNAIRGITNSGIRIRTGRLIDTVYSRAGRSTTAASSLSKTPMAATTVKRLPVT